MLHSCYKLTASNYRAALDAATALCLHVGCQRRGASERGRWTLNSNKPPQQKGDAKGMKLTIMMCLLGLLASLVTGCKTASQTPEQRSTRQTDRQMEERLRSMEQMMWQMNGKLDEINRKLPNR